MKDYAEFLESKSQLSSQDGFEPVWLPDFLFDFQSFLVDWALRRGRSAILADCGLGKTIIELVWAENVARKTDGRVLLLTPLAVGAQTVAEGEKFGIECTRSRDGHLNGSRIVIANYEKLHLFNSNDFTGCVLDESGILKNFNGVTRKEVTRFMQKLRYRLLATATPAPNDYVELGTSSEALGELGYSDMLSRFFTQSENASHHRMEKMKREGCDFDRTEKGNHFAKLAYRVSQTINQWVLKGHAHQAFWQWVCSWARACRKPSDLGFSDDKFLLPPLKEQHHVVEPTTPPAGELFTLPRFGLGAERDERRRTLVERSDCAARLVGDGKPAVIWCHLNSEGDALENSVPGAIQVKGSDSEEKKEESYAAFQSGECRVLITKPVIGAWGLNWQHCAHVVTYASHSYEQFYQSVRRCWRFGQTQPVTVDIISTTGEVYVRDNMVRKERAAAKMFEQLVLRMNEATKIKRSAIKPEPITLPSWIPK